MRKAFSNSLAKNDFIQRLNILSVVVAALFFIVFLRLFQIQVLKHDFYKALAQDQHEFYEKVLPKRGEIFIKDGNLSQLYPLAVNKRTNLVYAVPKNIENKKEVARKLAELLGMEEVDVFSVLNKENDPYEAVKSKVDDDVAEKIKQENISGIGVADETMRYYPAGSFASNVIGFLGYKKDKKTGQYGIEEYYNERLEGVMGFLKLEKDASGSWISFGKKNSQLPQNGVDIVLTINQTVQYLVEKKLKEIAEKFSAEEGNIIIMDPKSGEITAMAQYPNYNPNEYYKEKDMSIFLNSGIHNVYEPGSIQKPITMAIGIDLEKITPVATYVDEGAVKVDGWVIKNSDGKKRGKQTMIEVLEQSLNTGSVFVQQKIEKKDFYEYLEKFGLNQATGIELKGESKGSLSNLEAGSDASYATASFGQGISVTPIGMLAAISVFANDGKLMRPRIISDFIYNDGTSDKTGPEVVRRVVSPKTANIVAEMMVSVVDNGHSKRARLKGYKFAGKTGTAQVPRKDKKGYEPDKTIHTFVGFGPMPNPRFSVLIKLDYPKGVSFAENTVVPAFHDLAQELVNYYHIPPTEKEDF